MRKPEVLEIWNSRGDAIGHGVVYEDGVSHVRMLDNTSPDGGYLSEDGLIVGSWDALEEVYAGTGVTFRLTVLANDAASVAA